MDDRDDDTRTASETPTAGTPDDSRSAPRRPQLTRNEHLRAKLLVPLVVAVLGLTAYNIYSTWLMETRQLRNEVKRDVENTGRLMHQMLDDDALRLRSALGTFMHDAEFKKLFRARDRGALLERGVPLFRHLSEEYRLSRFYFIDPDGTAFARLHRPDDYGQNVTHATVQKAMQTRQRASGIELGKVAFALRVVKPYYDGDELIGYIEFAEDIDHILGTLTGEGATDIVIVVRKQFFDRAKWESASDNRPAGLGGWDTFNDIVVSSATFETLPPELHHPLVCDGEHSASHALIHVGDKTYGAGRVPMIDVLGREVGYAFIMHDKTARMAALRQTAWTQALVGAAIACALILLAYAVLRRTMRALAASRSALKRHTTWLSEALERERQVSETLTAVLNEPALDKPLQFLADSAREICGAELGLILLRDSRTGDVTSITSSNYSTDELPPDFKPEQSPPLAAILKANGVVCFDDITADPELTAGPERHPKARAVLGTALRDDSGTFGLFVVGHNEPQRHFTDEHKNAFATLAGLATVAIRRALTVEELKQAVQEAEEATEVAEQQATETAAAYEALLATKQRLAIHIAILEAANRRTSLEETLRSITEACVAELYFDSSAVYLLDDKTDQLVMACHRGLGEQFAAHLQCCPVKAPDRPEDLRGTLMCFNLQQLNERFADEPEFLGEGIKSAASVPLAVGERFVGLLFLSSHERDDVAPEARIVLAEIARSVQPAIANALQAEDLERFTRAAGGREDRVVEMKHEVNQLLAELGREPKYKVTQEQDIPTQMPR